MVAWRRVYLRAAARRRALTKMGGGRALPALYTALLIVFCLHTLAPLATRGRERGERYVRAAERTSRCASQRPPMRVFVHLHKTGGNTLKAALAGWARRNHLAAFHTCHPAAADGAVERLYFGRRTKAANATDCNLSAFAALPAHARERYDIVYGHQHVGVHTLLRRPAVYFTFVRDPLWRKASHYAHFERAATPPHRYLLHENLNYQTKRLATRRPHGDVFMDVRSRLIDASPHTARAALSAALYNLNERFFFVGVHERYRAGVCVLASMLNDACWRGRPAGLKRQLTPRAVLRKHLNRRARTQAIVHSLTREVRAAVYHAEYLDAALHRYARRRFAALLQRYPACDID